MKKGFSFGKCELPASVREESGFIDNCSHIGCFAQHLVSPFIFRLGELESFWIRFGFDPARLDVEGNWNDWFGGLGYAFVGAIPSDSCTNSPLDRVYAVYDIFIPKVEVPGRFPPSLLPHAPKLRDDEKYFSVKGYRKNYLLRKEHNL